MPTPREIYEDSAIPIDQKMILLERFKPTQEVVTLMRMTSRAAMMRTFKGEIAKLQEQHPKMQVIAERPGKVYLLGEGDGYGNIVDVSRGTSYPKMSTATVMKQGGWQEPLAPVPNPHYLMARVRWRAHKEPTLRPQMPEA